ncbi:Glu/Leu/Phe/Val dehydrogenase dimerization domain-containing protein [Leucobacter sp. HY1908]
MQQATVKSRPSFMEITWQDHETSAVGYVVIDRLLRGVSSGGLRMRAGCTLDEVRGLAQAMTKKESVHLREGMAYVPVGGAKGGINFDPRDPAATGVLERFLDSLTPILRSYWAVGEDLGVRQVDIDEIFERRGWGSSVAPVRALLGDQAAVADTRMARAFAVQVDGISQDEMVGGYGVTVAALTALEARGLAPERVRAVVQGLGSMGGATARFLARAGVRVVGVVDAGGVIVDQNGLDVEALLAARDQFGSVDRTRLPDGAAELPGAEWLRVECDLLVPAAISGCVTAENCDEVRASIIVEAANLPVTPEAEARLAARDVEVIPDFVANSGTNAWWWWLLFGDIDGTWESSRAMLDTRLGELTSEVLRAADRDGVTPREAALKLSHERLARMEANERNATL